MRDAWSPGRIEAKVIPGMIARIYTRKGLVHICALSYCKLRLWLAGAGNAFDADDARFWVQFSGDGNFLTVELLGFLLIIQFVHHVAPWCGQHILASEFIDEPGVDLHIKAPHGRILRCRAFRVLFARALIAGRSGLRGKNGASES